MRSPLRVSYDFADLLPALARDWTHPIARSSAADVTLFHRCGFSRVADSHEFITRFVGRTREELEREAALRVRGLVHDSIQPHAVGMTRADGPLPAPRRLQILREEAS